jgi:hypothetical protein
MIVTLATGLPCILPLYIIGYNEHRQEPARQVMRHARLAHGLRPPLGRSLEQI